MVHDNFKIRFNYKRSPSPVLKSTSTFLRGLRGVLTAKEPDLLQAHLPVHGLLLLQSVSNVSEDHGDHGRPQEHHLGGDMLCRQEQQEGR